jgi:hypothetical protein
MIKDFFSSASVYSKRLPGWREQLLSDIKMRADKLATSVNDSNNRIAMAIGKFAEGVSDIREQMSDVSDLYLTVSTVSGNTNRQFGINNMPILKNKGIVVSGSSLALETKTYSPVPIVGVKINTNGQEGNSADFDIPRYNNKDTIISETQYEVEKFDSAITAVIGIDLRDVNQVNRISMLHSEYGIHKSDVMYLEVSPDGKRFYRSDFSVQEINGVTQISFPGVNAASVKISLLQNNPYTAKNGQTRYAIGIRNLSIGIATSIESGEIVFGPITQKEEVLKASIAASIPTDKYSFQNISFEISTDSTTWYQVSTPFSVSEHPKHLDFNTKSDTSINTKTPVTTLFFRIRMTGNKHSLPLMASSIDRHIQQVSQQSPVIQVPFALSDKYIVSERLGYQFGERGSYFLYNDNIDLVDSISSIKSESDYVLKTVAPMKNITRATIRADKIKCAIEGGEIYRIVPPYSIDPKSAKAYKASLPVKREVRISDSSNMVLPFEQPAGIYSLTDGENSRKLNLTLGAFTSCYQWVFKPLERPVSLIDPFGKKVAEYEAGKYINLLDYFTVSIPTSSERSSISVTFNSRYPETPLSGGEFTLIDGKYYSASHSAVVNGMYISYEEIPLVMRSNINGIDLYTEEAKFSKSREKLSKFDGQTSAKLAHSGLLKGGLRFTNKASSLLSFVKEVTYINGIDEFKTSGKANILIPKSVNRFSLGRLVNHFDDIEITGGVEQLSSKVFSKDELVYRGDYMLEDAGNETFIQLPEGVKTDDIIDTFITVSVADSNSSSGLYSIDYTNGMLYSQSTISGESEVEYIYSNIFISGFPIKVLDKKSYTVTDRQVELKDATMDNEYIVLSESKADKSAEILRSPTLKNLALNTVTV